MPKISIIIPVYNTKKYLKQCLESIMSQTFKEIEIICVDDGSTDGSGEILSEYALMDNRIKVIRKNNGGQNSARNAGLCVASGKYIGYVDSDDWIEQDMYEKLYEKAEAHNVDMVSCGYFLEGNYTSLHLDSLDGGSYDNERMLELRNNLIYRPEKREKGLSGSLCCKLFKKEILQQVQLEVPEEITMAEDKMCLIHYVLHCTSAYVLKEAYYHRRIRLESMTHCGHADYLLKVNEVYKYLTGLYAHENFTEKMRAQAEVYITELLVLGINTQLNFKNKNLLRIDPYWLSKIPEGSRIVIYGGGDVGEQYKRQMKHRPDLVLVFDCDFEMPSKEKLQSLQFDYILIAIKNAGKAEQMKEQLLQTGIENEKIFWFEQPEVYWKYAEAEGIFE